VKRWKIQRKVKLNSEKIEEMGGGGGDGNLIIFYELALLLVICPFPAILFSLSASYNLIIFYELVLLLVIYPFVLRNTTVRTRTPLKYYTTYPKTP
jgi:hypothetical protein